MKKLLFLALLFLPFFGKSQGFPQPNQVPTVNITFNPVQNGWAITGNSCAGCGSVYYKILRTTQTYQASDGYFYYYYYFYFFSNSYYTNGYPATSYLTHPKFYADGVLAFQTQYVLVEPNVQKFVAWIRSANPNSVVTFHVNQISPY